MCDVDGMALITAYFGFPLALFYEHFIWSSIVDSVPGIAIAIRWFQKTSVSSAVSVIACIS
jgi:hypothetical protein